MSFEPVVFAFEKWMDPHGVAEKQQQSNSGDLDSASELLLLPHSSQSHCLSLEQSYIDLCLAVQRLGLAQTSSTSGRMNIVHNVQSFATR